MKNRAQTIRARIRGCDNMQFGISLGFMGRKGGEAKLKRITGSVYVLITGKVKDNREKQGIRENPG